MKNNNFLIALALCLGLSSTASFCMEYQQPDSPKKTASTWGSWISPKAWSEWYKSVQSTASRASQNLQTRASSALSGTLDLVNAMKKGVGLENVTYKTLGAALAVLIAAGYSRETILNIVGGVYDYIAPSIKFVGSFVGSGVVGGVKLVGSGAVGGVKLVGSGAVGGAKLIGSGVVGGAKLAGSGVVGGAKLVGSGAKYVATTPILAIPTAAAAGLAIANEMDKANARKKAPKKSDEEEESTE